MKKLILLLCLGIGTLFAQEAIDIVKKTTDIMKTKTTVSKVKMTIVTSSGQKREFIYRSFSKNDNQKSLTRYLSPSRVKGQATLMLNNADDIWMYFPRTNRVRKLATHAKKQKMQGSDFSYEDMGSGDIFLTDFDSKLAKETKINGIPCYTVELTKKESVSSSYAKMVLFIQKKNFLILKIDYYNQDAPEIIEKSLVFSNVKVVNGIPTAFNMVMKNVIDNKQTKIEILDIVYNSELSDNMFTERELKK